MRRAAALILGGGPAGSAAAIALCRGGIRPLVIERSEGPRDVVCGGFLGWDALTALRRLGVDAAGLGARPIERLRLVTTQRTVEARLPYAAAGLSRRALDEALLEVASAAGAEVARGRTVREADPDALRVRLDDEEEMEAEVLFLATGKHELRGVARPREALDADPVVGLRCAVRASPSLGRGLEGAIELHLFDGGYAGLLLQEDGSANLCLSVARERMSKAGGIDALVAELGKEVPRLGDRIAQGNAGDWSAIASVPYGWRAQETAPGLFRLGDQGAVIASLAGDGVAIALTSGMAAAEAMLKHGARGAEAFQSGLANRSARPLKVAGLLRRAAERRASRRGLMHILQAAPGLAPLAARLTRIER